jgi:pimeloyl-ACP methyl ester carboxylesterase
MQLRYISVPALIAEAGGDPWAINHSLQVGRPAQISDLAEAFHAAGRCTAESSQAFDDARRRFAASWNHENGENPINDSAEVQRVVQSLGAQSLQLPKIGADLENIAATLAEAQRTGATLISTLEGQLQQLDNEIGQAVEIEKNNHLSAEDRSALDAFIRLCEDDAIADTKSALAQLQSIRAGYSDFLNKSLTTLRTDGYDPAAIQALDAPESPAKPEAPVPLPPPGSSAEDVNRWWKTLTPEQQQQLIAAHPPDLGNLNGIPVDVRGAVNNAVMNDDLRRVEDLFKNGVTRQDVLNDPAKFGLSPSAILRYTNACQARDGLAKAGQATDKWPGNHPPVYLLRYEPEAFGGEGAAAIAIGNPDTAANTAVLVKGLGTGVREGTLTNPDGVRLYEETARADWNKETAVVLWVGYDAPNTWHDPGLYEPNMARTGGQLLAADVNALGVTHQGAPTHMTVVGHSYGSTVVSDAAAAYGMHSNDVVLVGSPGTDLAHSAADFHLSPGGHLYVGAASADPVTWSPGQVRGPGLIGPTLGGLGDDPSVDGYGSTRFKAENPQYTANPIYDHSHYFDNGSESLFSIADVVSGHGDALQHDGMTARHRGEYGMGNWFDPEALRPGTTGHVHSGPAG